MFTFGDLSCCFTSILRFDRIVENNEKTSTGKTKSFQPRELAQSKASWSPEDINCPGTPQFLQRIESKSLTLSPPLIVFSFIR